LYFFIFYIMQNKEAELEAALTSRRKWPEYTVSGFLYGIFVGYPPVPAFPIPSDNYDSPHFIETLRAIGRGEMAVFENCDARCLAAVAALRETGQYHKDIALAAGVEKVLMAYDY